MNVVTQTQARAVTTVAAAPLEAADPTKNLILVPLSRLVLRPTGRNVRKTPRMSIPELAASIQRVGLLQNLIVIAADGEHYEVVAGGRRLAALKLLAKKHRISKEWEVPCLLVADGTARTASLTENVQREAMHPADQFEAFAALVAEGRPIEDIAADFSVTPLVVQRRLKLANVSPRLMADYRADAVTLDQLMALAITDDHAAQEAAFYDAPTWQRQPSALRDRLTEQEIDAYRHPLVRFVGLDTYEAAGGGARRDLFAEGDAGVYLTDTALLDRLAQDRLAGIAAEVKAEGWAWVDATPGVTHADLHAFQRAPRERREPTKREAQRIEKLQAKVQAIGEALDDALVPPAFGLVRPRRPHRHSPHHGPRLAACCVVAHRDEGMTLAPTPGRSDLGSANAKIRARRCRARRRRPKLGQNAAAFATAQAAALKYARAVCMDTDE